MKNKILKKIKLKKKRNKVLINFNKNILFSYIFIFLLVNISFASSVIYHPVAEETTKQNVDIYSDPFYLETTALKPYAKTIVEPTGVRIAENLRKFGDFSSSTSKAIIGIEATEDLPITQDSIKYIKHTQSITKVEDGTYNWQKTGTVGKWTLNIFDRYLQHEAKNGFYMVEGKIYYFDNEGHMYIGTLMDERDTVYIFDETGQMIYKNP